MSFCGSGHVIARHAGRHVVFIVSFAGSGHVIAKHAGRHVVFIVSFAFY